MLDTPAHADYDDAMLLLFVDVVYRYAFVSVFLPIAATLPDTRFLLACRASIYDDF